MFSHVFVGANDIAASKKFYDAVLGAIGVPEGKPDPKGRIFYRTKTGMSRPHQADRRQGGDTRQRRHHRLRRRQPREGQSLPRRRRRQRRQEHRGSARLARGCRRQALSRLPARSVRQQDLRAAPRLNARSVSRPRYHRRSGWPGRLLGEATGHPSHWCRQHSGMQI